MISSNYRITSRLSITKKILDLVLDNYEHLWKSSVKVLCFFKNSVYKQIHGMVGMEVVTLTLNLNWITIIVHLIKMKKTYMRMILVLDVEFVFQQVFFLCSMLLKTFFFFFFVSFFPHHESWLHLFKNFKNPFLRLSSL